MTALAGVIDIRTDTAANWTSNNPTLVAGELGYESDTGRLKVGNGSSAWTALRVFTLGTDRMLFDASDTTAYTGSPAASAPTSSRRYRCMAFDASSLEGTIGPACDIGPMRHWTSVDCYLWLAQLGSGTGNAVLTARVQAMGDGDSTATATVGGTATIAMSGNQFEIQRELLASAVSMFTVTDKFFNSYFFRDATNGSDTYAADVGILGLELVRA